MGAHTPEEIVNAYSDGDCWALAQALEERYESMTLVVLGNEDDGENGWVHMLVRDDRDPQQDTYVDINGAQSFDELSERWEWDTDWTDLVPLEARHLSPNARHYPHISVDAAIEHVIATGWTPPARKGGAAEGKEGSRSLAKVQSSRESLLRDLEQISRGHDNPPARREGKPSPGVYGHDHGARAVR